MNKFVKTVITTAASGAAAAYHVTTTKSREIKDKTQALYEDYKANPDHYHRLVTDAVNDYKKLAVETFNDYKQQFEQGDLTIKDFVKKTDHNKASQEPLEEADETTVIINLPESDSEE